MNTPIHQLFRFSLDSRVQSTINTKLYNKIKMWELYGDYMAIQVEISELVGKD